MRIPITEESVTELQAFIPQFRTAIEELDAENTKLQKVSEARASALSVINDAGSSDKLPADKEILAFLISHERARQLDSLGDRFQTRAQGLRKRVATLAHEAAQLLGRVASKQTEDLAKKAVLSELPDNLRSDDHIALHVWSNSAARKALGSFLNPPGIGGQMSLGEVVDEGRLRIQTLERLAAGEEVFDPGVQSAAPATS
jgi:hypothetical protein